MTEKMLWNMQYLVSSCLSPYSRYDIVRSFFLSSSKILHIVGVQPGDKHADSYLNKRNVNFQVLPSFILPFSNKILKDMVVLIPSWNKYNAFHGEHYFEQLKQLPPEGIINWEIKILDLLDKGKATVYCFSSKDIYWKN